jgi:hypothetical protein
VKRKDEIKGKGNIERGTRKDREWRENSKERRKQEKQVNETERSKEKKHLILLRL